MSFLAQLALGTGKQIREEREAEQKEMLYQRRLAEAKTALGEKRGYQEEQANKKIAGQITSDGKIYNVLGSGEVSPMLGPSQEGERPPEEFGGGPGEEIPGRQLTATKTGKMTDQQKNQAKMDATKNKQDRDLLMADYNNINKEISTIQNAEYGVSEENKKRLSDLVDSRDLLKRALNGSSKSSSGLGGIGRGKPQQVESLLTKPETVTNDTTKPEVNVDTGGTTLKNIKDAASMAFNDLTSWVGSLNPSYAESMEGNKVIINNFVETFEGKNSSQITLQDAKDARPFLKDLIDKDGREISPFDRAKAKKLLKKINKVINRY